jgi:formamidopyrimidine-DNA glycosylase
MPELPEVETIRRGLEQTVVGFSITAVEVRFPKIVRGDVEKLIGATILSIRRFGKGLVIDLDNDYSITVHVKMTGQLVYRAAQQIAQGASDYPNKWTHVIFRLERRQETRNTRQGIRDTREGIAVLYYADVRKFGWIEVVKTEEVSRLPFFQRLGPEPLRDLELATFRAIVSHSQSPIKIVLMDQHKIAGVGNIYANDALYLAGIHPKRLAKRLSEEEIKKLFVAVETVLRKSIAVGGTSARNYVNVQGEKGNYQKHFLIYDKAGKVCERCGRVIERITLGGRGTFYCPGCQ